MPRLNRRGEYLCGVGGGAGNLHIALGKDSSGATDWIGPRLRPIICAKLGIGDSGEGSGWLWLDDDTMMGQFCGDPTSPTGCSLWKYHFPTATMTGPWGQGANNGVGRGGVAGFWLGTGGYGVYTTTGYRNQKGAVPGVYDNGDFLILKDYQQTELGFLVVRGTSVIREIPTVGQEAGAIVRGSIAIWVDYGDHRIHADGAPQPLTVPNWDQTGAFAADKQGRIWICNGQYGLCLRAWDQAAVWWLSRDEYNFSPDLIAMPDGRFRVVSSTTSGEAPNTIRCFDVDPLTGAYTLNGQPGQAELRSIPGDTPIGSLPPPAQPIAIAKANGMGGIVPYLLIGGAAAAAWYYWGRK